MAKHDIAKKQLNVSYKYRDILLYHNMGIFGSHGPVHMLGNPKKKFYILNINLLMSIFWNLMAENQRIRLCFVFVLLYFDSPTEFLYLC